MKRKKLKGNSGEIFSMEFLKEIGTNSEASGKPTGGVIILLLFLFMISFTLLAIGLLKGRSTVNYEPSVTEYNEDESIDDSISDFFDEAFSKTSATNARDEVYLQDDPFREECESTSGDGVPAISFGTVCYR